MQAEYKPPLLLHRTLDGFSQYLYRDGTFHTTPNGTVYLAHNLGWSKVMRAVIDHVPGFSAEDLGPETYGDTRLSYIP